ncbi:COP9 signalosome complex subunit 12 [Plectosphaerella plurivora]|uniref:COP9 signalosome complex subunit 12 n=1 Tax=Plectosphaerella plurivora TaxID=936078 RepID=A0A9P9ACZ9_9PEZI|nr:COP9 signalosome complex subunit 12 [Plectosphaerella plurivora]
MQSITEDFATAFASSNGWNLSITLSPVPPSADPDRLRLFWQSTNHYAAKQDIKHFLLEALSGRVRISNHDNKTVIAGWVEVYTAYWKAIGEMLAVEGDIAANGKVEWAEANEQQTSTWAKVYEAWKELCIALHRGYTTHEFQAWTVPCLYTAGKYLRAIAIKSDEERVNSDTSGDDQMVLNDDRDPESNQHNLRDCEQQLKRMFTLCLADRSDITESRKWGVYGVINLLFKTYFKLNSASLARTILKALSSYRGDMPSLDKFPASQRVTFKYYEGVLAFLEENYVEAEKHLDEAWTQCHKDAKSNLERILTYLIPCRLLTTHTLPSQKLLEPYPRLQAQFGPLANAIRKGDLRAFDLALQEGEDEFVKKKIYLTLERSRDIALRNLLRKVFLDKGFAEPKNPDDPPVRQTRVRLTEFTAAISLGSRETIDPDEVECLLANMIYKAGVGVPFGQTLPQPMYAPSARKTL